MSIVTLYSVNAIIELLIGWHRSMLMGYQANLMGGAGWLGSFPFALTTIN